MLSSSWCNRCSDELLREGGSGCSELVSEWMATVLLWSCVNNDEKPKVTVAVAEQLTDESLSL
jgi:hypothetical protein